MNRGTCLILKIVTCEIARCSGVGPPWWPRSSILSAPQIAGEATEGNGTTADWLTFETAVARGKGYLRLKTGKCWTLLTATTELKGFEEK